MCDVPASQKRVTPIHLSSVASQIIAVQGPSSAWKDEAQRPGKPQKDGKGVLRFGEHWGISREQCQELLLDLRMDPHWDPNTDMYTFVNEYVKPRTEGRGMGLALLMNRDAPLEVNKMVSHCWAENVEEFLAQVIQSTAAGDVLFICAFSIYQCEDDAGPSIQEQIGSIPSETPFGRVLSHVRLFDERRGPLARHFDVLQWLPSTLLVAAFAAFFAYPAWFSRLPKWDGRCHGLLLSIDGTKWNGHFAGRPADVASPSSTCARLEFGQVCAEYVAEPCPDWAWPLQGVAFALLLASIATKVLQLAAPNVGGMIVVPTRAVDMYTRLWCVYEIFFAVVKVGIRVDIARTLISCGVCASEHATCSNEADRRRIRAEVEENGGFTRIDMAVQKERRQAKQKICLGFLRFFVVGLIGCAGEMMLLAIEPGFAFGMCAAFVMAGLVGAIIIGKLLIPMQGLLTKRQALLICCGLPLFVLSITLTSENALRDWWWHVCGVELPVTKEEVQCQAVLHGLNVGSIVFSSLQLGTAGVTFILLLTPNWGRHRVFQLSLVCSTSGSIIATTIVVYLSGAWSQNFGKLLPRYDALVACAGLFAPISSFFVYVPSMLVEFDVNIKSRADDRAGDTRAIEPDREERLVYFWDCRVHEWHPFPAKPPRLNGQDLPAELRARGLGGLEWEEWIRRLEAVTTVAWQNPRMWLWTALGVAWVAFMVVTTPLVAVLPALLIAIVPRLNVSPFQRGLRKWLDEFNQVLAPLGMLVRTQTIKRGGCEASYLSFALTPEESAKLRAEPTFVPGESMCVQGGGIDKLCDSGRRPMDWGRVI